MEIAQLKLTKKYKKAEINKNKKGWGGIKEKQKKMKKKKMRQILFVEIARKKKKK